MRTVAILGTECTGKSTLAAALGAHYGAPVVAEAGRDLIPNSARFSQADLLAVAAEHARRIAAAHVGGGPLLLLDTDVHITQSYAHFAWGEYLPLAPAVYARNRADLHLYLAADVPYVQDGTRLPAAERLRLDLSHRRTLAEFNVRFIEIRGSWPQRWEQAQRLVDALLAG